jgi:flagellar basal-body rod protein FlgF
VEPFVKDLTLNRSCRTRDIHMLQTGLWLRFIRDPRPLYRRFNFGHIRALLRLADMDNLSISAVSGLRSRMISLDMLANNLANSATSGYKNDREYYGLYSSDDAQNSVDGGGGATLPTVEKQWTDFSPGVIEVTGNPLDVAISGKGFFGLTGPNGPLYTRNGSFQILPTGDLGSTDGTPLRGLGGSVIHVQPNKPIVISPEGFVRQNGAMVGQIEVVNFKSTEALHKTTSTAFENTDPAKNPPTPATGIEVQQGKLEGSNVPVADAAMRLVGVMRQFEMLQKAVGVSSDMDTKSIQEVARVTS